MRGARASGVTFRGFRTASRVSGLMMTGVGNENQSLSLCCGSAVHPSG